MPLKNTREEWGVVSKTLHWLVVALILAMAWLGLTILALVLLRLGWRLYAGAPETVPGTPPWQERIASLTHWALYALLLAMPLSGWVLNSSSGFPLQWFGLFNLPAIVGKDHDLHELAEGIHELLVWALAALVVAHAAAAFYHHLFQRDATLARMLPRGWLRTDTNTENRDVA